MLETSLKVELCAHCEQVLKYSHKRCDGFLQDTEPEAYTAPEPANQPQGGLCSWQRLKSGVYVVVDRYANFMGSIGGVIWSVMLLAVWLVIGSFMGYSNANWWLIIGTYTGLVRCSSIPAGMMPIP